MKNTTILGRLWTVQEVSDYLGVPIKTLYQWKWRGEGPPVRKVGRYLRYDPTKLLAWIDGQEAAA